MIRRCDFIEQSDATFVDEYLYLFGIENKVDALTSFEMSVHHKLDNDEGFNIPRNKINLAL